MARQARRRKPLVKPAMDSAHTPAAVILCSVNSDTQFGFGGGGRVGSAPLIDVRRLTVRFPPPRLTPGRRRRPLQAVERICFAIAAGEAVGMVGESGCGKSTVARVLVGLQRPTSGEVLLRGGIVDFDHPEQLRRAVQMVFQDPASSLNPRLRIGTQVTEPLRGHLGVRSRKKLREAAIVLLEKVGLTAEDAERFPHQFSGGQRQRIALARALAIEPELLVADEPVASLDVAAQAEIAALLKRLHAENNLALLLISHDLAGVSALTGRVVVVYLGRVMEEGLSKQVLGSPKHPYTSALLDATPRLERDETRERIVLQGDPPSPFEPPSGCVFRTRCPVAFERCSLEVPPLFDCGPARRAACFLCDT
jgi:oligopeptide/dipeptide ABC transporter ATP-binding protein